jgi:hypothetical protein
MYNGHMTALLQKVIDSLENLPEPSQDLLATWLLAKVSTDLEDPSANEAFLQLSESAFEFWNDPENDIWDTL